MCVRWLSTVRSPTNRAAATSRFVRPSTTSAATPAAPRPPAGGRPPRRGRPPADAGKLSTCLAGPQRSTELLEDLEGATKPPARGEAVLRAPLHDTERGERPSELERVLGQLVLGEGGLEELDRTVEVAAG